MVLVRCDIRIPSGSSSVGRGSAPTAQSQPSSERLPQAAFTRHGPLYHPRSLCECLLCSPVSSLSLGAVAAHISSLLFPHSLDVYFFSPPFLTNPQLSFLSFLVMGVADPPCSGYVQDGGQQHAVAKQGDQKRGPNGKVVAPPGTTTAIRPDTHTSSSQRRPTPTTSTVSRPRSGWCGFPDSTSSLPGPLAKVLGR